MSTTPTLIQTISPNEYGPPEVDPLLFSWFDYSIFSVMLGVSIAIGVYVVFFGKNKQDNIAEYYYASKTMNIWPVAVALIASEIIDHHNIPSDIYFNGAASWMGGFSTLLAATVTGLVYLPVFFKLQLTCIYEYLSTRFDQRIRLMTSFFFVFSLIVHMPFLMYVPALAFKQATGINIELITIVVCAICIFYTAFGGLRAVVWNNTFQTVIIVVAMFTVLCVGLKATGTLGLVFQRAYDGGRLNLWEMNPDPTINTSFWTTVIGTGTAWAAFHSSSQNIIQKFMAAPTLDKAKKSVAIYVVGSFIFNTICVLTGLIMYAKYSGCDPVTTKQAEDTDQLFQYFIMDVAGKVPGLPGLFIAAVYCAALSTLSSDLNTVSGVIYEDFVKLYLPAGQTEKRASDIMKLIVVIVGVTAMMFVLINEYIEGHVYILALILDGILHGTTMGIFTLGMLVPFANTKGTLAGAVGAALIMGSTVLKAQYYESVVNPPTLPVSINGCDYFENITSTATPMYTPLVAPWILQISSGYYPLIGASITIIIGAIVSLLTGGRTQNVNKDLLSPVIYFLLPKDDELYIYNSFEHDVELTEQNAVNVQDTK